MYNASSIELFSTHQQINKVNLAIIWIQFSTSDEHFVNFQRKFEFTKLKDILRDLIADFIEEKLTWTNE